MILAHWLSHWICQYGPGSGIPIVLNLSINNCSVAKLNESVTCPEGKNSIYQYMQIYEWHIPGY